jgi:two-component system, OmpR family, sensor histidine kinase KdpD
MTDSWEGDLDRLGVLLHDLQTPLAAILGLAITLEREDVALKPDEAKDLVSRIADNARRLDRMVADLLDLNRMARGVVELTFVPSDIAELAARVVEETDVIEDRTVIVEGESVTANVDPARVERIVENLLSNSVRQTSPEGRIWLCVREQDGGALIVVEDEGPEVPSAVRETMFQPFGGRRDRDEFVPTSGIGLALAAGIAELHGGRAWVEDRDGGGASFRVWLPDARPVRGR